MYPPRSLYLLLSTALLVNFVIVGYGDSLADETNILMRVKAALDPDGRVLRSWSVPGGAFEGVAWNGAGKVANISLQGRGLSGFIPSAIAELTSLTGLYLHYNNLQGPIPTVLYKLSSLTNLYLNVNRLSGTIPAELGLLYNLQALQLCCNNLEGLIPMELGALKQLNVLAVQHNHLVGSIPSSLGYLVSLTRLDLSFNALNGSIPAEIGTLPQLALLDVSNNSLSGSIPPGLRRLQQGFVYGNNSFLCGEGFAELEVCGGQSSSSSVAGRGGVNPDQPLAGAKPSTNSTLSTAAESANPQHHVTQPQTDRTSSRTAQLAVVSGVVAFAVGGVIIGMLVFILFRRHKQKISSAFELSDPSKYSGSHPFSSDLKLFNSGVLVSKSSNSKTASSSFDHLPSTSSASASGVGGNTSASHRISRSFGSFSGVVFFNGSHQSFQYDLEELEVATNFFSDKNLLGKRGTHSAVYKGILRDGSTVAIRALHKASCKAGMAEFKSVVSVIAQLRHENIVALKGFCCSSGKSDCFLVYDFMTNGTLQEHLEKKPKAGKNSTSLDWAARARIAINVSRGLHFMHKGTEEAVVHQNVSATNILIDENCNAYISDAGLHKLLADDIVFSVLKSSASRGYLSPEYVTTGRLTEKSDVYALGVILMQLLTGKTPLYVASSGHDVDDPLKWRTSGPNNMVSWARSLIGAGCVEELMDPNLKGKYSSVAATHMAAVAFSCTQEDPTERPDTAEVVRLLQKMDTCAESVLEAGLSSGEDYPRRQQALFAERLLDNGR